MQQVYRAVIKGDRIEWRGESPPVSAGDELQVEVSVDELPSEPTPQAKQRMLEAFERLAQRGTFADIDPVAWQREQRKDRPLPGRE